MSCFSFIFDLLQKESSLFFVSYSPTWVIKPLDWFKHIHPSAFVNRACRKWSLSCRSLFCWILSVRCRKGCLTEGCYSVQHASHIIQCAICKQHKAHAFPRRPDRPDHITVECSARSAALRPCGSPAISAGPDGTAAVFIVPLMSPLIQVGSPGVNQTTLLLFFHILPAWAYFMLCLFVLLLFLPEIGFLSLLATVKTVSRLRCIRAWLSL